MSDKIYVVTASANKGQGWIICKALYSRTSRKSSKRLTTAIPNRANCLYNNGE